MIKRNMSLNKVARPELPGNVRNKNFEEVAQGYTEEMAMEEAVRCLNCKNKPCVAGCPVNVQIPEFIEKVTEGKFIEAYEIIKNTNSLPGVCGRVCPQESQCEGRCVRAIKGESVGIGRLERFCSDYAMKAGHESAPEIVKNGRKVAVVGSGPAGLTCAGDLAKMGYDVTVFEAFHVAGGVLQYGIPQFRLPKELVNAEIDGLKKLGVKIELNMVIGKVFTIDELKEQFDAIFIGSGAGLPSFMHIPGENLNGVYSANEFLTRINLMKAYRFPDADTPIRKFHKVAVVGGGNVAMDAARCAMRLGAGDVSIVYRRGMKELPARQEEVHHAQEEGIAFHLLTNPVQILGDERGWVRGLQCIKMTLGEPDASGRRRPIELPGSEYELEADVVIMALGTSSNPLIRMTTPGLETDKWGGIVVNGPEGLTSREKVYAGGDAVTGSATVILAMGAGKDAAKAIDRMIREKDGETVK